MLNKPIWTEQTLSPSARNAQGEERTLDIRDVLFFLKRRRLQIFALSLIGAVLGGLYNALTAPVYTARSQILIDTKMPPLFTDQNGEARPMDTGQIAGQVALLKSEKIALMTIEQLRLLEDPELRGSRGTTSPSWIATVLQHPIVRFARGEKGDGDPADPSGRAAETFKAERSVLAAFGGRLDVRRSGLAYALDISFTSTDPEKAARIANGVVDAFFREKMESRISASRHGTEWLSERVDQIRRQMNASVRAVQELRASHDYRIKRGRERRDEADQTSVSPDRAEPFRQDATLEELESSAQTLRRIYEGLLGALADPAQRQSAPVLDSRVITVATRPLYRSSPALRVLVPGGAAAAAGLYIGFGLLRLLMGGTARTKRQVRNATGLDCLGWVARVRPRWTERVFRLLGVRRRSAPRLADAKRVFAALEKGLRWVRPTIAGAGHSQPIRMIGVAAAVRTEGLTKAMVTVALARLYAGAGSRTLIIDAEISDPVITRTLAADAATGLFEALQDGTEGWRRHIVSLDPGCDLLPLVRAPAGHPGDLLGSPAMEAALNSILDAYDIVILDMPPIRETAEIMAVAPTLDGVILVAEWGRTRLRALAEASESLDLVRARVLGTVLIDVDPAAPDL